MIHVREGNNEWSICLDDYLRDCLFREKLTKDVNALTDKEVLISLITILVEENILSMNNLRDFFGEQRIPQNLTLIR